MANFQTAIDWLKRGEKVTRVGWNGNGMYIWLKPSYKIKAESCKDNILRGIAEENGGEVEVLGTICMKTADNKVLTGWLASQTDILSDDWKIVVDDYGWDDISPEEKPTSDDVERTVQRSESAFNDAIDKYKEEMENAVNPYYDRPEDFANDVMSDEDGKSQPISDFMKKHKIPEVTDDEKNFYEAVKKLQEEINNAKNK